MAHAKTPQKAKPKVQAAPAKTNGSGPSLPKDRLLKTHELMVRARCLEERLIKMSKSGDGFFWIGGPGEEAWNVPLGLSIKRGQGIDYDYMHLHYRSSGIVLSLGAKVIDGIRQMRSVAADPYSKGRNFVNHFAIPEWNVLPVSPTIETQYATAIGTGIAQARTKTDSITIVNGGDAGTAEGDFHSCLVWANRPALPLPILIVVVNNGYGISTEMRGQHGEKNISDWGRVFDMPAKTINGNDVFESYASIQEAMAYVRKERRPYLLEVKASRLYGHSSSSGANRIPEPDCIALFEQKLIEKGVASKADLEKIWKREHEDIDKAHQQVKQEPFPKPESIWEDVFASGLPDGYPTSGGSF